jgi:WD40 repeat protein
VKTGKHTRSYKPEGSCGELYKVSLDPSGMYAATCSFDKWIRLFDFYSGTCLAKVRRFPLNRTVCA